LQGTRLFLSEPNLDALRDLADLRQAISRLPRRQREIVFLHYYMDLGLAESASLLGISEGTAKKALHRARLTLATSLRETEESRQPKER
jgi:RNA polymerase sigma-70 factor (ECF subfamily)